MNVPSVTIGLFACSENSTTSILSASRILFGYVGAADTTFNGATWKIPMTLSNIPLLANLLKIIVQRFFANGAAVGENTQAAPLEAWCSPPVSGFTKEELRQQ